MQKLRMAGPVTASHAQLSCAFLNIARIPKMDPVSERDCD